MTDFLEMAMADIDDVFFQEFVEQHTIDGETFDVVPYETGLKERKSHWEAGAKQNFDQGLYISQKQFFIRAADYGPAPKIGKPMEYDRISYTIKSCQNEHGLYCRIDKGHCIGDDYGCECNHRHAKQSVFYGA